MIGSSHFSVADAEEVHGVSQNPPYELQPRMPAQTMQELCRSRGCHTTFFFRSLIIYDHHTILTKRQLFETLKPSFK